MLSTLDNHEAHDHAGRIRERLPRQLQELREAAEFTKCGLSRENGVIREKIGRVNRAAELCLIDQFPQSIVPRRCVVDAAE
ncbi:MAG: hypothetical protein HS117_04040 [Verrucomicrobiaceae bacterium]|nr:hypothetical protein [Verrucomicrobiaceae bacterium]